MPWVKVSFDDLTILVNPNASYVEEMYAVPNLKIALLPWLQSTPGRRMTRVSDVVPDPSLVQMHEQKRPGRDEFDISFSGGAD